MTTDCHEQRKGYSWEVWRHKQIRGSPCHQSCSTITYATSLKLGSLNHTGSINLVLDLVLILINII